ncbi:YjbF family lipoprotein [Siccirubricoccus sp. KC 17139]|uniref:YjbF family lipoprotein n=1 Tax=Siccirubricoccus soli TaxID=2899147 RepID=A0ABT1CYK2_9PROT|nr:YjbF family lipoprotein [Siccirubricoccus soli]MCO6414740.1 YjbF family lipoprotein [Siccirubricoccus soli]MCP2680870.1 YjbF family lipoprotein [Siccirubricoccus soli]
MRARLASLACLLALLGCAGTSEEWLGLPRLRQVLPDLSWQDVAQRLPFPTEEEEVSASGNRVIRVWVGRRAHHAILLQELGTRRLWRTASGIVIATDGGRVVATSGLRDMLVATRFDGPDPLDSPGALLGPAVQARRMIDLMRPDRNPEGMRFGISVECRLQGRPTEENPEVLLVTERCRAPGEGRFTNRYWVTAADGQVLRAEQWVGADVPTLALEFAFTPAS